LNFTRQPFALVHSQLRGGKRGAASAAPPTCNRARQQTRTLIGYNLIPAHRENQIATAVRAFTLLHRSAYAPTRTDTNSGVQ
jgi:hypothetical protein